jgi:hypothetical protein
VRFRHFLNFIHSVGSVASALSNIAGRLTTPQQVTKMQNFLLANQLALGDSGVQQVQNAIADLEWEWSWAERNAPAIREYVDVKKNSASTVAVSVLVALVSTMAAILL